MFTRNRSSLSLDKLLCSIDTNGIEWEIILSDSRPLPKIRGIASLSNALNEEITFLSNAKYRKFLSDTKAGAVILSEKVLQDLSKDQQNLSYPLVLTTNPYLLYARLAQWFEKNLNLEKIEYIDPSATIASSAIIGKNVRIYANCVIGSEACIGEGCILEPFCVIGPNCKVGSNCHFYPRVTLYKNVFVGKRTILHSGVVLGSDGFGYASNFKSENENNQIWEKIPQFGRVIIGNDVEIGANTTIDRGALDDTVLGNGVKLDNLIMVGHNVKIKDHTAIAACVGIAGSTSIGQYCTIGGAAMISGHLILVDHVHVSGGTAVISDILESGQYTGIYPFSKHSIWKKNIAVLLKLGQLRQNLFPLEKK
ncbi:MAG: UDP-3-O-(3-hydroxymyristoyl)glucosamine N-acyltransferase [Bordetella sp.]|nr:MAG: UDP-3-O-(3-hydroxymyristoyl)glucosamine N-acyltransferase [Bordetella sp.]